MFKWIQSLFSSSPKPTLCLRCGMELSSNKVSCPSCGQKPLDALTSAEKQTIFEEYKSRREYFSHEKLPMFFWKCPICHNEDTIKIQNNILACSNCNAKWGNLNPFGMTRLDNSQNQYLSYEKWYELGSGTVTIHASDSIPVPIILQKGEGVILFDSATLHKEETKTIRSSSRSYSGVSIRIAKGLSYHTGSVSNGDSKTYDQITTVDSGQLILTNQRLVFRGGKKVVNMDLKKIISASLYDFYVQVGYGNNQHLFTTTQSPFKWQAYIHSISQHFMNTDK